MGGFIKIVCDGDLNYRCAHSDTYYKLWLNNCEVHLFSSLCPNDPGFYQVCGHQTCQENRIQQDGAMLCGSYICSSWVNYYKNLGWYVEHRGGVDAVRKFSCNGRLNCLNTVLDEDETVCPANVTVCQYSGGYLDPLKTCDGHCDCYLCEDESDCVVGKSPFGIVCDNWFSTRIGWFPWWNTSYVPPAVICDGVKDCYNGLDERYCSRTNRRTCNNSEEYLHGQEVVLTRNNSCTVPNEMYTVCSNFLDQQNCSETLQSPLTCKVGGYETSVTRYAVCEDTALCDDKLETACYPAEGGCKIHKHRFCDDIQDCPGQGDERSAVCTVLTEQTCQRRFSINSTRSDLQLPLEWVMDGVEDCMNGEDENPDLWIQCGSGWSKRYFDPSADCADVFICSNDSQTYVEYQLLCDKVSSCAEEGSVCKVSRNRPHIWDKVTYRLSQSEVLIGHSLPGLTDLDRQIGGTHSVEFVSLDKPFGVPGLTLHLPNAGPSMDCRHVYGEMYVYLSCLGHCQNVSCVLKPVKYNSCESGIDGRVLTLSDSNYLTIVRQNKGSFVSDLFPCDNGFCVTYDKVCNLMDDCGDLSDEANCVNNFTCVAGGELLPITSRLDGKYDCTDFSDECFEGKKIIDNLFLEVFAWGIGIMAVFLNCMIIIRSVMVLSKHKCALKLLNRLMITFISLGDLMVGVYLLLISIENILTEGSYCTDLFDWLSSSQCAFLGVISTVGSQLSLSSMTVLSLTRVFTVGRLINYISLNFKHVVVLLVIVIMVLASSVLIAVFPLLNIAEDFFVNGLYYPDVPLFIGAPSKDSHMEILRSYYPKLRKGSSLTWQNVIGLVREMFTQDYGGVKFRKLHFFGNDGVCLFKYFVTPADPQSGFTCSILILNFLCFIVITVSYIIIHFKSVISSKRIRGDSCGDIFVKRNRAVQRKITLIIISDFLCWMPFITTCLLHYYQTVDASSWYSTFSIIILPINSVINPLLYDDTIARIVEKARANGPIHRVSEIFLAGVATQREQCGEDRITNSEVVLQNDTAL